MKKDLNNRLSVLYKEYTSEILLEWSKAFNTTPPNRINEFGVIDRERYNGILFIGRETNGWDYEENCLFCDWMHDISINGIKRNDHLSKYPNMWYNIGRWAMLIQNPDMSIDELVNLKDEAIHAIGTIAFTNINKVKGKNKIGKEYHQLANSKATQSLLLKEVEILKPKIIVACGTSKLVRMILKDYDGIILDMYHPGARKSSKAMLEELKKQLLKL